jgi:hypothetical protein
MTARRELPQRRQSETFEFDLDGVRYVASVSEFETGGIAEIFIRGPKIGSAAGAAAHDAAVTASLALQFGVPLTAIRKALLKLPNGTSAGPLGRALDLIDARAYG